jgi:hypothetical protein
MMSGKLKIERGSRAGMMRDDDPRFVNMLDAMKASYAVEFVLEQLQRKGNRHTLASVLELIRSSRK